MKKYLLIGKSEQMRSSFRCDPVTKKFVQFKIGRGIQREITEDEMTFHIQRQAGFKILKIVEIEEEVVAPSEPEPEPEPRSTITWDKAFTEAVEEEPEAVEEEPEVVEEPTPKHKKRRSRRKKVVEDE